MEGCLVLVQVIFNMRWKQNFFKLTSSVFRKTRQCPILDVASERGFRYLRHSMPDLWVWRGVGRRRGLLSGHWKDCALGNRRSTWVGGETGDCRSEIYRDEFTERTVFYTNETCAKSIKVNQVLPCHNSNNKAHIK